MKSPRVLISASAGSGKTYQLVHHFLGILYDALLNPKRDCQPAIVERILAATFTRAAAGEIIDRILKRVAEALLDPRERAALGKELGAPQLREEECGKLLQALVASLHRLRVCTLDSFLIRSSQAFSTELGLPDNWTILDDAADKTVALEAIDQLLTEHAADPQRSDMMLALLIMLNQGQYKLQIRERLMDHLRDTQHAMLAGPAEAWDVIGPQAEHLLGNGDFDGLAASFFSTAEPLIPRTKAGTPNATWVKALTSVAGDALASDWDSLIQRNIVAVTTERDPTFARAPMSRDMIALLRPVRDHAAASLLSILRARNISTRVLLTEFVREYRLAKLRRSGYRFDDFTEMLHEAGVTDDLGDFYFRLDGKIDHILLDEFQDTSIPQWKLIEPLVAEIMSGSEGAAGGERTFFCVGDIKQTLYGWRNAEPELLNNLTTHWTMLEQQHLLVSQRSAPVIIDTVNQIFGAIGRNPVLTHCDAEHAFLSEAGSVWTGWFKEHETVKKGYPGFCRMITCDDGECAAEKQASAIKLAADRVSELHAADPVADIAILLRRKRFIAPLLARLRRMGIAASGEGGSPLADDVAVLAVLSLLHLIDHPSDTAAVFHVKTSPLGRAVGITEGSERNDILARTTELRTEILDRGLGSAINRWMGLCAASSDARNFRRLQRLVTLAHGFAYDGGDLRPFIETVRGTNVEDSDASKVRVMTIHASKGRQFDYVILPDLDGPFAGFGPSVLMSRRELLGDADCITVRPSAAQAAVHERLAKMVSDNRRRQLVEELCVLYVALTRAETGLELIVHPQEAGRKLPSSPAGVLRGALTDGAAPPNTQIWAHEDNVMPAGTTVETEKRVEPLRPIAVRISPPSGVSRLRPEVTPSGLEGSGYIDLSRMFTFEQQYGLNWGSVLHRWFEMIEWLDEPIPGAQALRETAEELELNISPKQLGEMLESFHKACAAPNVAKLLRRANYLTGAPTGATVEVWRERSFAVPFQSSRVRNVVAPVGSALADAISGSLFDNANPSTRSPDASAKADPTIAPDGAIPGSLFDGANQSMRSTNASAKADPTGTAVMVGSALRTEFPLPRNLVRGADPTIVPNNSGMIVRGQIDRVVIVRAAGRVISAEVVDYKTDLIDQKTSADKAAHYAPQLRAYSTAVACLLGIDESLVLAKLAFVGPDIVVKVL